MEANDIESESDQIDHFQETGGVQHIYVEVGDYEDVHVCRKCNMVFYEIRKYMEHKVKHDNYKVKYFKSDIDKRMVMPRLVQKLTRVKNQKITKQGEEKENDEQIKKGKRGICKLSDAHNPDVVISERPVYTCSKCDRKFNREASLKRHLVYDHKEDSDEDIDGDLDLDDDRDQEYRPSLDTVREGIEDDEDAEREMQDEAPPEMDSLDQVIMAAALVEKAEAQGGVHGLGQIHVSVQGVTEALEECSSAPHLRLLPESELQASKRQKLGDVDRAGRRFVCSICLSKFKELAVLKAHMLTHSNVRQYVCGYEGCNYAFKTKGSLKRHMRRHTGERPYPCDLCGRNFTESGALTRHLKSRTSCTSKSDNDLPRYRKKWTVGSNIPASVAAVVGKQLPDNQAAPEDTSDHLIQHVINIRDIENNDVETEEHLGDLDGVTDHIDDSGEQDAQLFENSSGDGGDVVISDGVETFIADEDIQQFVHTETVSQLTSTICQVCKEEYLSVDALKIHLRTHLPEDTCKCQLCHYITGSKEDFENHMYLHHQVQIRSTDPLTDMASVKHDKTTDKDGSDMIGDAKTALTQLIELPQDDGEHEQERDVAGALYKCPVCSKQFRGSNYLKLHLRNHTGLRPHRCIKCYRSFITRDTLRKHMATHVEDRNFKCGECGKLFKRLSHVREHIKIHSGSRPFPCNFCDKSFKTNNAMKVHLRTHTAILPYECTFCHRRFREKGSLIRHTRMHTGEKPYECIFCGRRFSEHGTLNRHLKAKVSCKKQMVMTKDYVDDDTDYTVLAEFSSVVADTQQYIVPDGEVSEGGEKPGEATGGSKQLSEIVVVQADESEEQDVEVENAESVAIDNEAVVESLQVTDDYLVITDEENNVMRVLDKMTGETVAIVPMTDPDNSDSQIQTITMTEEGEISTVTMVPEDGDVGEMVTIAQLIGGQVLTEALEMEDGIAAEVINGVETEDDMATEVIEGVDTEDSITTEVIDELNTEDGIATKVIDELEGIVAEVIEGVETEYGKTPDVIGVKTKDGITAGVVDEVETEDGIIAEVIGVKTEDRITAEVIDGVEAEYGKTAEVKGVKTEDGITAEVIDGVETEDGITAEVIDGEKAQTVQHDHNKQVKSVTLIMRARDS